jgi:putative flippase GtrA
MQNYIGHARIKRWFSFILGGAVNTGFTYLLYLVLNETFNYQVAYFIAYTAGIVFSYWFNARIVFKVPFSWKRLTIYPSVYVLQYSFSAVFLGGAIEFLGCSELIAPLLVATMMIPVTYFMSKVVIMRQGGRQNS